VPGLLGALIFWMDELEGRLTKLARVGWKKAKDQGRVEYFRGRDGEQYMSFEQGREGQW
jgi:hypothetical protein